MNGTEVEATIARLEGEIAMQVARIDTLYRILAPGTILRSPEGGETSPDQEWVIADLPSLRHKAA